MCEANGCVEPIGSLPDLRGDSIHVCKCIDSVNATHPHLNFVRFKISSCLNFVGVLERQKYFNAKI